MTTRGATSEVHPSHRPALDARVTPQTLHEEEAVPQVSTKGSTHPAYEVSLDLFGEPFEADPAVRAEIWCEHEEMRELDDPPSCDLGPSLTRGDLR